MVQEETDATNRSVLPPDLAQQERVENLEQNPQIKYAFSMKPMHDSQTPAAGRQVFTAVAFIHQVIDGVEKVFLVKRAETKKFLPGVYELPGGHIDFGEEMTDGLRREIREELGIEICLGDPFHAFTYTNPVKGSHSIEVIYFACLADPRAHIRLHSADHAEYGWFAEVDLDSTILKKAQDDPEMLGIKKGFSLLRGASLQMALNAV